MDESGPKRFMYLQEGRLAMHHKGIQACYDLLQPLRVVLMNMREQAESFLKLLSILRVTSLAGMRPVSRATCNGKGSVCAMSC
jgi:hypothetical protein